MGLCGFYQICHPYGILYLQIILRIKKLSTVHCQLSTKTYQIFTLSFSSLHMASPFLMPKVV